LADNTETVPEENRSEVDEALSELKSALEGTDIDAIKAATEKTAEASQKLGAAMYAQNAQAAAGGDGGTGTADDTDDTDDDDEVVEAEIVDEDKDNK
jgi:molecular chaperone DnaK